MALDNIKYGIGIENEFPIFINITDTVELKNIDEMIPLIEILKPLFTDYINVIKYVIDKIARIMNGIFIEKDISKFRIDVKIETINQLIEIYNNEAIKQMLEIYPYTNSQDIDYKDLYVIINNFINNSITLYNNISINKLVNIYSNLLHLNNLLSNVSNPNIIINHATYQYQIYTLFTNDIIIYNFNDIQQADVYSYLRSKCGTHFTDHATILHNIATNLWSFIVKYKQYISCEHEKCIITDLRYLLYIDDYIKLKEYAQLIFFEYDIISQYIGQYTALRFDKKYEIEGRTSTTKRFEVKTSNPQNKVAQIIEEIKDKKNEVYDYVKSFFHSKLHKDIILYDKLSTYPFIYHNGFVFQDKIGSYHLNLTLPYGSDESIYSIRQKHITLMKAVQLLEPLFIGVFTNAQFGSFNDNHTVPETSYRSLYGVRSFN